MSRVVRVTLPPVFISNTAVFWQSSVLSGSPELMHLYIIYVWTFWRSLWFQRSKVQKTWQFGMMMMQLIHHWSCPFPRFQGLYSICSSSCEAFTAANVSITPSKSGNIFDTSDQGTSFLSKQPEPQSFGPHFSCKGPTQQATNSSMWLGRWGSLSNFHPTSWKRLTFWPDRNIQRPTSKPNRALPQTPRSWGDHAPCQIGPPPSMLGFFEIWYAYWLGPQWFLNVIDLVQSSSLKSCSRKGSI